MKHKSRLIFVKNNSNTFLWATLFLTLLIKLYLAHIVPITGDEAEYIYCGQHFSWGYHDHPPMIGWILALISTVTVSNIGLRMPQILVSTIIGCCMYHSLKKENTEKAALITILYLISPVSLFNQGILTDTPLALFSFLSINSLFLAARYDQYHHYILSGLFIGAAFFSKYLIFPIALSIALFFLFSRNIPNKWKKFLLLVLFSSPFVIQNILWNYSHDWMNVLFNLDLRHTRNHFELRKPLSYLLSLLYLYNPLLCYYTIKKIKPIAKLTLRAPFRIFTITTATTLLFYGALSLTKRVGLHWTFAAYPFLFMILFSVLKIKTIKKCITFMFLYCLVQLIVIITILHLPLSIWKKTSYFNTINWFLNYQQTIPTIQPYIKKGFILSTPSYAQSYLLAYKHRWDAAVWGTGSVHGRQDDLSTDFKAFDKKNILIVDLNKKLTSSEVGPYFKKTIITHHNLNGMPYRIILGYHFNYLAYRDTILKEIYNKYYRTPKFLPRSNPFYKEKYFQHELCSKTTNP